MMIKTQNRSHAVMAQRHEPMDSLDDFPTPPWATRALVEHVIGVDEVSGKRCLEPACGRGYMATALKPYFDHVAASDVASYGFGDRCDFLGYRPEESVDWIITNPPFRLAEDFFHHGHAIAQRGVALLVRTLFLEGIGRLERMFSKHPPTTVAQFSERVPMVKGRLDRKASTATGYAWVIWRKPLMEHTRLIWIPPCRKILERLNDYEPQFVTPASSSHAPSLMNAERSSDLFGNIV